VPALHHLTALGDSDGEVRKNLRDARQLLARVLEDADLSADELQEGTAPTLREARESIRFSMSLADVRAHLHRTGFEKVSESPRHEAYQSRRNRERICILPVTMDPIPGWVLSQVYGWQAAIRAPEGEFFPVPSPWALRAGRTWQVIAAVGWPTWLAVGVGLAILRWWPPVDQETARWLLSATAQAMAAIFGIVVTVRLIAVQTAKYTVPAWQMRPADIGYGALMIATVIVPLGLLSLKLNGMADIAIALAVVSLGALYPYIRWLRKALSPQRVLHDVAVREGRTSHPDPHEISGIGEEALRRNDLHTAGLAFEALLRTERYRWLRGLQGYAALGAGKCVEDQPIGQAVSLAAGLAPHFSQFMTVLRRLQQSAFTGEPGETRVRDYNLGLLFCSTAYFDVVCALHDLAWRLFRAGDQGNAQLCTERLAEIVFAECARQFSITGHSLSEHDYEAPHIDLSMPDGFRSVFDGAAALAQFPDALIEHVLQKCEYRKPGFWHADRKAVPGWRRLKASLRHRLSTGLPLTPVSVAATFRYYHGNASIVGPLVARAAQVDSEVKELIRRIRKQNQEQQV
jgi:hypothetical protein